MLWGFLVLYFYYIRTLYDLRHKSILLSYQRVSINLIANSSFYCRTNATVLNSFSFFSTLFILLAYSFMQFMLALLSRNSFFIISSSIRINFGFRFFLEESHCCVFFSKNFFVDFVLLLFPNKKLSSFNMLHMKLLIHNSAMLIV